MPNRLESRIRAASTGMSSMGGAARSNRPGLTPTIAAAHQTLAQRRENIRVLQQNINSPDFYRQMARFDRGSAAQWNEMAQVQARFARAEPSYNQQTRTYSESMRESLHRSAIELYRQNRPGQVYDDFIAIHPALFYANGAFSLNPVDQARVLGNTHGNMANRRVLGEIFDGTMQAQNYAPLANQVAEQTRRSREARGLPITPR